MSKYQENKARIRAKAIDWQNGFCDQDYDWLDLARWGAYFERQGKRYGLLKEFRENGII